MPRISFVPWSIRESSFCYRSPIHPSSWHETMMATTFPYNTWQYMTSGRHNRSKTYDDDDRLPSSALPSSIFNLREENAGGRQLDRPGPTTVVFLASFDETDGIKTWRSSTGERQELAWLMSGDWRQQMKWIQVRRQKNLAFNMRGSSVLLEIPQPSAKKHPARDSTQLATQFLTEKQKHTHNETHLMRRPNKRCD